MTRLIIAALLWAIGASFAFAQSPVQTQPKGVTTGNYSGTIAVTNTFQSVLAASSATTGRLACAIQNNGTNSMYVYFGPIANATTAKSVKLAVGQSVNCNSGNVVLKDQVSITGTSGEAFYASQQ